MDTIKNFYEGYLTTIVRSFTWNDAVEIVILSFVIYNIVLWIKKSRAWTLLKGAAAIFSVYLLAALFHLNDIVLLFNRLAPYVVTSLIVIFQPEIRRAMEQLGTSSLFNYLSLSSYKDKDRPRNDTVEAIVRASYSLGRTKTGALIVIEMDNVLTDYIATGISLDAVISSPLLVQIFEHNTPLHDGAVIIRGNRIAAATCYLPLSENKSISKELGTRHRAGLGISEVTDSFTVIVSEETGAVSVARGGMLYRNLDSDKLRDLMTGLVGNQDNGSGKLRIWKGKQKK